MWMILFVALLAETVDLAWPALCDGSQADPPVIRVNGVMEMESTNGTSPQEWIFESDDFMTISFTEFNLSGPECSESIQSYEKVRIKSGLDGDESVSYVFCKGRRRPDDAMSSKGRLHVAYCNRHPNGVIKFTVTAGCTAQFLVQAREKTIIVKKRTSSEDCWISLKALNLLQGHVLMANFSNLHAKSNKKEKCQRSYISVHEFDNDGSQGGSLLPNRKKKACSVKNIANTIEPFVAKTDSGNVNISYKSIDFTLTFWEEKQNFTKIQQIPPVRIASPDSRPTAATNDSTVGQNTEADSDEDTGQGLIIALGCGGLLALLAIIGTLVYLKKRATRSSKNSTTRKKSRDDRPVAGNGDDLPRNPSIGSLSNAMYGQMVSGDNTASNGFVIPKGTNESRKQRRLVELEEKYGPFSETAENHKQSQRLIRKDTRPQLPPPMMTTSSAPVNNTYETIDDIHVQMQALHDTETARPCSYATMTSDEFSDDEESAPDYIDPVVPESNYASILDGQSVSYDPVNESSRSTIPKVEYSSDSQIKRGGAQQRLGNSYNESQSTPKIQISSPIQGYASVTSHTEPQYQKPKTNRGGIPPNLSQAKSQCSLPTSRFNDSVDSSLQEDSENYLRPRPSCPDTMVTCAYSSTEDISEIRRRLLAAAHPSLLQGSPPFSRNGQGSSDSEVYKYDSPRPSNSLTVQTEHQYASPRRKGDAERK